MANMMEDKVVLGVLAGWVGNVVKEALTWALYFSGYVRYTFVHIAAGFYVSAENIDAPVSLLTGAATDWIVAGTFGVALLYILKKTGPDYAVFKGAGFGALVYVIVYGVGMALDVTRATLVTPLPNFLLLFPHILIGAVAGWFLEKNGRETVLS